MAMEVRSDAEISKALGDAVLSDSRLQGSELSLAVRGGKVSLDGWVPHFWQKKVLFDLMLPIRGILEVEGDVEVRPPVRRRDLVLSDLADELLRENAWLPSSLSTQCIDGVVLLSGTVNTLQERRWAEDAIQGLQGLMGITNQIGVCPTVRLDDLALAEVVRSALGTARLSLDGIGIQVLDRMVILTGSVPTLADRVLAGKIVEQEPGAVALHNKLCIVP